MANNKEATGNCFVRAFHLQQFNQYQGQSIQFLSAPLLVHGIVWHEATGFHCHGWVEDHLYCYDFLNGKLRWVFKERYYQLGKIKTGPGEIMKYSKNEARVKCLGSGDYYFSSLPCDK